MSRRSRGLLEEWLRRGRERAAEELGVSVVALAEARLEAERRGEGVRDEARARQEALREVGGVAWSSRQALFARTESELVEAARQRDEAVEKLRSSRERMRESAAALAWAIAVERAARSAGGAGCSTRRTRAATS